MATLACSSPPQSKFLETKSIEKLQGASLKLPLIGPAVILPSIVIVFLLLTTLLPLGRAIKIGADEDFELSKVPLVQTGHKLYTEVWNDQPPLYTWLLLHVVKLGSSRILGPRLLTIGFSTLLLSAFFLLVLNTTRRSGAYDNGKRLSSPELIAGIATLLLIGSPGFIELSSSCMQEIPALTSIIASISLLFFGNKLGNHIPDEGGSKPGLPPRQLRALSIASSPIRTICAALLFSIGLQLKLIGIIYLPIIFFGLWVVASDRTALRTSLNKVFLKVLVQFTLFGVCVLLGFLALNYLTGAPLRVQFQQSWDSHFSSAKSLEYGSPSEHPYDWTVLWKNWDALVPALAGVIFILMALKKSIPRLFAFPNSRSLKSKIENRKSKIPDCRFPNPLPLKSKIKNHPAQCGTKIQSLPLLWFALTLIVFSLHKPWWQYYYIHNALPLCWLAAIGIVTILNVVSSSNNLKFKFARPLLLLVPILFLMASLAWMGARIYLQERDIRSSPKVQSSYLLKKFARYKPYTQYMFTDQPIYSFHSGVPVPPHLAMLSLKRFWTGEMTNERLVSELEAVKPGIMLLANDSKELPYQDLLMREYQVVYTDDANRLLALKSIARKGF
jgi:hypothetical protein